MNAILTIILITSAAQAQSLTKLPLIVRENYVGKTKEDFEKGRDEKLVEFRSEWCKREQGCISYITSRQVLGGTYDKQVWTRNGKIAFISSSYSVYPQYKLNQMLIAETVDDKDPKPYLHVHPNEGGQGITAWWQLENGLAKITGFCPGGFKPDKTLYVGSFRQCRMMEVWVRICTPEQMKTDCKLKDEWKTRNVPF